MDKISVIVPVYNTAPYLRRCIESIQEQTFDNYELILIDDGSTDESGRICDEYVKVDYKIKVVHQKNKGVSVARNQGLKNVSGKYFMFLDSDDSLEKDTLQKCYERMESDNSDVVVFGWREIQNNKIVNLGVYGEGIIYDINQAIYDILKDRHIYGGGYPNKMWRTNSYMNEEIPMYNSELFYVEDMEWVIRMLMKTQKMSLLNEVFYNYHLRGDSASKNLELHEKRLVGYHDTLAQIVNDLKANEMVYKWFQGIQFSELVNSTLDAWIKKQKNVTRELYGRLRSKGKEILYHKQISKKVKFRYLFLMIISLCYKKIDVENRNEKTTRN